MGPIVVVDGYIFYQHIGDLSFTIFLNIHFCPIIKLYSMALSYTLILFTFYQTRQAILFFCILNALTLSNVAFLNVYVVI